MPGSAKNAGPKAHSPTARIVERNIQALLDRRKKIEQGRGLQHRAADLITRFAGSLWCVYAHLVLFGLWIVINLGWTPLPKFDPTFVVLAMFASVEAIFLSTFVLITQNRMQEASEERADLDLQISLLAEHEITRLITLTSAIAERLALKESQDSELPELKRDIRPEQVMEQIEQEEKKFSQSPDKGT